MGHQATRTNTPPIPGERAKLHLHPSHSFARARRTCARASRSQDASVCHRLLVALRTECVSREVGELDFRLLCSLLLQHLKSLC